MRYSQILTIVLDRKKNGLRKTDQPHRKLLIMPKCCCKMSYVLDRCMYMRLRSWWNGFIVYVLRKSQHRSYSRCVTTTVHASTVAVRAKAWSVTRRHDRSFCYATGDCAPCGLSDGFYWSKLDKLFHRITEEPVSCAKLLSAFNRIVNGKVASRLQPFHPISVVTGHRLPLLEQGLQRWKGTV